MQNIKSDKKELRCSNIELLRIIAMLIIVGHHFAEHGGFDFSSDTIGLNRLWVQFIHLGGKIGVNIFVLISGYFLISAQTIKTNKLVKLWGQVFFYSIAIFTVFVIAGREAFGIKELIASLAPVTFSRWWFASTYIVLYVLSPYINRLLHSFDQKQYIGFLMLLILIWSVIPTFTEQTLGLNYLLWFVLLYSLSGYIRLYGIPESLSSTKLIGLAGLCFVLTFMATVVLDVLGMKLSFFSKRTTFFYPMNRLPVFIISVLMFMGFSKLNIRYNKLINTISSATFGVYLIHDHILVRPYLWKTVFRVASYSESNMLIPYSLFVILIIFVGCSILEIARARLLERRYMPMINRLSSIIDKCKATVLSDRILNRFTK